METKPRAISQEVEGAEAGFDEQRLQRLTDHFKRYVDDGRLPGWLIAISRKGKVVYVETYGQRDKEAGQPVELDTIFRIYSMTKPITTVAAMMLSAHRPGQRDDDGLAPAHAHERLDLWLPPRARG